MPDRRRATGATGEDAVAAWYRGNGYEIVARNWRVREGEIDLIVRRAGELAFCEVKTRRSNAFGAPVEAVTGKKQQRIRLLARRFLAESDVRPRGLRFDVASVMPDGAGGWDVDVLEAAF